MSKGALVVGWTHIEINTPQMILLYSILGFVCLYFFQTLLCSVSSRCRHLPLEQKRCCDEMLLFLGVVVVVSLAALLSDGFEE